MNQRRRLTAQERDEAAAEASKLKHDRQHFNQEWTNPDGKPVVVTIIEPY
jgi:hypothetical protein